MYLSNNKPTAIYFTYLFTRNLIMKNSTLKAATIALFSALFIMGCEDNTAEEAGERIDEAVTDAQNAVEDACEEVKEGVKAEETNC